MDSQSLSPVIVDPKQTAFVIADAYHNSVLASLNDHEIRISVMTSGFGWHFHPDSDEIFLAIEGDLTIELEGAILTLSPSQMVMIPRGTVHRTRPTGARSVNLTFEKAGAETRFVSGPSRSALPGCSPGSRRRTDSHQRWSLARSPA